MGLLDSIFHHWDVLPTVDHRRLLELCRGFDWPEPINPPPNSYYKIHGLRSQVLLEPHHGEIFDLAVINTLSRTILTSVTTLLALISIYILGGEILRGFSFAMILGVIIGTYSSIFVAAPVLKFFKVSYKTIEKEEEKIVP